jgi:hypothetical protein
VKWSLLHEHDPHAQIAAIKALVALHCLVIEHGMLKRIAATRTETASVLAETSRLLAEIDAPT